MYLHVPLLSPRPGPHRGYGYPGELVAIVRVPMERGVDDQGVGFVQENAVVCLRASW